MSHSLLPLEEYAQRVLGERRNELPDRNADYWARYTHLLAALREQVYPHVNAGLSCLSKSPGIYTDHGPDHFDEVVRYAGFLLGLPGNTEVGLKPYEIYLLLCAIRLHDAGNIEGREEHEMQVGAMLALYGGSISHDQTEATLIARIAQAHGGRTLSGDRDTIGELPPDGTPVAAITCRPRQVAALVRFADEICEHKSRAALHYIKVDALPPHNQLFHYYASSISGAACSPRGCFKLSLSINTKYLEKPYLLPPDASGNSGNKYLIDDVLDRILKLDRERRYCNQFLDPGLQTNELDVCIELTREKEVKPKLWVTETVDRYPFRIPAKEGYPGDQDAWRHTEKLRELKGCTLAERAKAGWKNEQ